MKLLKKVFRCKEYNLKNYKKTSILHYDRFVEAFKKAGMHNITLSYPGPPSTNDVFTTKIDGSVYYAYWDKNGYLCINETEGINNSNL